MTTENVLRLLSNPLIQNALTYPFKDDNDDNDARFFRIDEVTDRSPSQLFEDIKLYVNSLLNRKLASGSFLKDVHLKAVIQNDRRRKICFAVVPMQPVDDIVMFDDEVLTFTWTLVAGHEGEKSNGERHWLLKVPSGTSNLDNYFQRVSRKASACRDGVRQIDIYTNREGSFSSEVMWTKRRFAAQTRFRHLHLEHSIMYKLEATLDAFLLENTQHEMFGDPERLGILLQGPPGTGKTKTIAAMANEKGLNIYNLELTSVKSDEDLRQLLDQIEDPCIVAIEDFDESLQNLRSNETIPSPGAVSAFYQLFAVTAYEVSFICRQSSRLTINGFLNLLGGLRSFGERKRIYVLTANDATVIPPKLQRFGRIDLKLELSYMTTGSLDRLWMSHFSLKPDEFVQLTRRVDSHCRLTAAEAHRLMLDAEGDADLALRSLHQRIFESIKEDVVVCENHTTILSPVRSRMRWVAEVLKLFFHILIGNLLML